MNNYNSFLSALERSNPAFAFTYDDRELVSELLLLRNARTPAERAIVVTQMYGEEFLIQHAYDSALEHAIKSDGLTFSHRLRTVLNYRHDRAARRLIKSERMVEAALDWSEGRALQRYEVPLPARQATAPAHNPWSLANLLFNFWFACLNTVMLHLLGVDKKKDEEPDERYALPRGLAGLAFVGSFLPAFAIAWGGMGLSKAAKKISSIDLPKLFRRKAPAEKMEEWIAKLYDKQNAALSALADRIAAMRDSSAKHEATSQLEQLKERLASLTARERERVRVLTDEPSESDVSDELKRLDEELSTFEETNAATHDRP